LRREQKCGRVVAHKKTPTQEGDILIVHGGGIGAWNSKITHGTVIEQRSGCKIIWVRVKTTEI
jgi:hypothetical protein